METTTAPALHLDHVNGGAFECLQMATTSVEGWAIALLVHYAYNGAVSFHVARVSPRGTFTTVRRFGVDQEPAARASANREWAAERSALQLQGRAA